ncbi:hypothetical protein A2318_02305 [Candidatus Uhrbacteria bacterium RIFOXYB2_FULL_45_11]|uniref:AB hydrolase-1 domain-containing protein n=1 Tax=Candidatus Uhrbacteria bacterium RIFOXYB2_FULL_45_11 TaxID=1802421 RepID=A0A1F7W3V7_9BACT|nr:MAG: hypothetical protein A2318_02305 [Candidatus Uhrbacteria bacterium RIFOXYB2_FULL_45_11]
MSRIVLLHGFAVHLTAPVLRPPFGPSASMTAFDKLVSTGEAKVFPWGIERNVSPIELLNPSVIQKLYKEELDLIHSNELQTNLKLFLEQEQPKIVVCHSMGCTFLQLYLAHFSLPSSVKSIVMIQSDLPINTSFHTSVPIHHLYCPWDPTLILSSVTNKSLRAGLLASKNSNVQNILFPLVRISNLHTSSIRDKKLIAFINSLS